MNPVKTEEECQQCKPVPRIYTPMYQQTCCKQCFGLCDEDTQRLLTVKMVSIETPSAVSYYGSAGDLSACQLRNSSSSLPQVFSVTSAHSSKKPAEDALQKRELRLMKNREAARECRRKKKEYVKCLENRVAVLENQNKTLIEELRALKEIYRHKVE